MRFIGLDPAWSVREPPGGAFAETHAGDGLATDAPLTASIPMRRRPAARSPGVSP